MTHQKDQLPETISENNETKMKKRLQGSNMRKSTAIREFIKQHFLSGRNIQPTNEGKY